MSAPAGPADPFRSGTSAAPPPERGTGAGGGTGRGFSAILCRWWWTLLLRGALAVAFGFGLLAPLFVPLGTLAAAFAALALADGAVAAATGIAGRRLHDDWWMLLLGGLPGAGFGTLALVVPHLTEPALYLYIALWALTKGLVEIGVAVRVPRERVGDWALILGPISIAFGVVLLARQPAGATARQWATGAYALASGLILATLARRMRALGTPPAPPCAPP